MTGQNSAVRHQTTEIEVTGCPLRISITRATAVGTIVRVHVRTTAKGTVTITGSDLRKTHKVLAAGNHTVDATLNAAGRSANRHHGTIKFKVTLKAGNKSVSKGGGLKL
jgi:hypothetical protein